MFSTLARRLPVGAEPTGGGVEFRVWAPKRNRVAVVIEGAEHALAQERDGYWSGQVSGAGAGTLYRVRLDHDATLYPDPASRFQPQGPHGPSEVIDPADFAWSDRDWHGVAAEHVVAYEMHLGTFTREGTWEAAMRELPALAELGVTMLEVMPVADFPGAFGWGYDGVALFAPTRLYGRPDDMRRFVDRAHALGMGVVLDVVYNHVGPDGNYLPCFSDDWFSDRYKNEWGDPINFDGENSGPVREFFVANAGYWIDEFHLDGLRLDATQQMFDASPEHVLIAIGRRVREAGGKRRTWIVNENEPQQMALVRDYGLDALWNDDFHHSARVALTGRREAYYTDYAGTAQELVSIGKRHFLYQGQRYKWQGKPRGTPTRGFPPHHFVNFLENHDQIANSARGARLHTLTSIGRWQAMTAYLLLGSAVPMLFMGQEFGASSPFLFFADHKPDLARAVKKGREEFLAQFQSIATAPMRAALADPGERATFERCKLDHDERRRNEDLWRLHRDLLRLRREDDVFSKPTGDVDGAVLADEAFVLRFFGSAGDRLLLVNLGGDLALYPIPEPLLAPPDGRRWRLLWSSEDVAYGGCGTPRPETEEGWRISGHAALVMADDG